MYVSQHFWMFLVQKMVTKKAQKIQESETPVTYQRNLPEFYQLFLVANSSEEQNSLNLFNGDRLKPVTAICLYLVRRIKIIHRYCPLHDGNIKCLVPPLLRSWPYSTSLCGTKFFSHQNSTVFPTSEIQIQQFLQLSLLL